MNPKINAHTQTGVPVQVGVPVERTFEYVPAVFQGNAPPPAAPALEELPWVKAARKEAEAKQREKIQQEKREALLAEKRKKKGFFNSLSTMVTDVAYQAESLAEKTVKETTKFISNKVDQRAQSRFTKQFPEYGPTEELLWHADGCIISAGEVIKGELYTSQNYVSFFGQFIEKRPGMDPSTKSHDIRMCVALVSILCLQPAFTVPNADKTKAPMLQPCTLASQIPTALMLFTNDRRLHLLYSFSNYAELYNVLDHQWRSHVNINQIGAPAMLAVPSAPSAPPASPGRTNTSSDSQSLYPNLI